MTDLTLFNYINGLATHSQIIDKVGIFLAQYLQYILAGILIVLLFLPKAGLPRMLLMNCVLP